MVDLGLVEQRVLSGETAVDNFSMDARAEARHQELNTVERDYLRVRNPESTCRIDGDERTGPALEGRPGPGPSRLRDNESYRGGQAVYDAHLGASGACRALSCINN